MKQKTHESFYWFVFHLCVVHLWSMALIASTDNNLLSPWSQLFCFFFYFDCNSFCFSLSIMIGPHRSTCTPFITKLVILIQLPWIKPLLIQTDCTAQNSNYRIRCETMLSRGFSQMLSNSIKCVLTKITKLLVDHALARIFYLSLIGFTLHALLATEIG